MVRRRHELHEMSLNDIPVFPQCRFKVRVDDALLHQLFLNTVVYDFRIVLGSYAGQGRLFRLGNPQSVEGVLDVVGHVVPAGFHLRIGPNIGNDVVHMEFADIGTPNRIFQMVKNIQRFQTEIEHPFRFFFFCRNSPDDVFRQAGLGFIGIGKVLFKVIYIAEIRKRFDRPAFVFPFLFRRISHSSHDMVPAFLFI